MGGRESISTVRQIRKTAVEQYIPNRFGESYYPHGVQVPIARQQRSLYHDRGDQVVRLNRREGIGSPTGAYRCEIPGADGKMVNIYITESN